MFIRSQEKTRMFFPRFEIQPDLHSNYAAFLMNHGPAPQLLVLGSLARLLACSLAHGYAAFETILALGVGFGELLK